MNTLFGNLFEWWKLFNFYGTDMQEFLRGFDALTGDYTASARYTIVGFAMLAIAVTVFATYYFLVDSVRLRKRKHWLIFLFINLVVNFIMAFVISSAGVSVSADQGLLIGYIDCTGFAISVSVWSLVIFIALSASPFPRKFSTNCKYTPWKQ